MSQQPSFIDPEKVMFRMSGKQIFASWAVVFSLAAYLTLLKVDVRDVKNEQARTTKEVAELNKMLDEKSKIIEQIPYIRSDVDALKLRVFSPEWSRQKNLTSPTR